jgi:hypothetical protein
MICQPGGDSSWDHVLAHRPPDIRPAVRDRFVENGITPDQVLAAIADGGDALHQAATSDDPQWT